MMIPTLCARFVIYHFRTGHPDQVGRTEKISTKIPEGSFSAHERGLNQMGSWKHNETLSKNENIRFTWDEQVYLAIWIKFISMVS